MMFLFLDPKDYNEGIVASGILIVIFLVILFFCHLCSDDVPSSGTVTPTTVTSTIAAKYDTLCKSDSVFVLKIRK